MTTRAPSAPWRRSLLTILLLLAVAAGLIWGVPRLVGNPGLPMGSSTRVLLTPPACDLNRGSCRLTQDDWTLEFSLGPAPIASLKPLQAELILSGLEARAVTLLLEGRDMYMGLNETRLEPTTSDSHWQGSTELAVCSTGRMVWRARVLVDTDNTNYETWFDFEAR